MINTARDDSTIPRFQAAIVVKILLASVVLVAAALALSTWVTTAPTHWSLAGLGSSVGAFALASRARSAAGPAQPRRSVAILRGLAIGVAIALAVVALTLISTVAGVAFDTLTQS